MSLLSNLNTRIKSLATRIAQQFKTQQTAIDSKVSKSGDTMTGSLSVPSTFTVRAQNNDLEGGEIVLDAANTSLLSIHIDNYDNNFRWIFYNSAGGVTNIGGISSSGVLNLPNGTAIWIA